MISASNVTSPAKFSALLFTLLFKKKIYDLSGFSELFTNPLLPLLIQSGAGAVVALEAFFTRFAFVPGLLESAVRVPAFVIFSFSKVITNLFPAPT